MDTDKQLAFYIPSLTAGGAQRVTVNLANGFARRGVSVDLIVAFRRGELTNQVNDDVTIIDLRTTKLPVIGAAASIPAFVRYFRQETPDVLFSQMRYANVISVIAHHIAGQNTILVLTEHTIFGSMRQRKSRVSIGFARRLHPLADHVVAVSRGVAESVRTGVELSEEQISVIQNPIVTPSLLEKAESPIDHPWLNSSELEVILGVGRLTKEKDFRTLIESFALLKAHEPSLRLVILGDGTRRELLREIAAELEVADQVSLPGFVDNPYAYMQRADVFALSSKREGLPTALIEAMACGCPVVATDCRSGPREILAGGEYGPLVPVGDTEALAAAIGEALENPIPSHVLNERAEAFSVEAVLDEYEQLIDRLSPVDSDDP